MPPLYTTILRDARFRQWVQEGFLKRSLLDGLFPHLRFRNDLDAVPWPVEGGDQIIMTRDGLMAVDLTPLIPGTDPIPVAVPSEQFEVWKEKHANTTDVHLPTSHAQIVDGIKRKMKVLGKNAAQTIDRRSRNVCYNAGLSGQTVAVGVHTATTTLNVARINGFLTARVEAVSPVRFQAVSATNALPIEVFDTGGLGWQATTVTAAVPTTAGDEFGPGVLTLSSVVTTIDRDPVRAVDRSFIVRTGGGDSVDAITAVDLLSQADIRSAVARLREQNVPPHEDGFYHAHLDPTSESELFADTATQNMIRGVPDNFRWKEFALGQLLGCVLIRNTECPRVETVGHAGTDAAPTYSTTDPFAGELVTGATPGLALHRVLITGAEAATEVYDDESKLLTEAGVGEAPRKFDSYDVDGIQVSTDHVLLIIRPPQDRLAEQIAMTWKYAGGFTASTDIATGDGARYKREVVIEHA